MFREFAKFAMRGNVIDLAVGIIIGAAFGKIVSSLVSDILMPVLGLFLGKVDFSNLYLTLSGGRYPTLAAAKAAGAATLNYGLFLNAIVDFTIVAFAIFLLIRWINRFAPKPAMPPETRECPFCHSDINVRATRCPSCTSMLDAPEKSAAEKG